MYLIINHEALGLDDFQQTRLDGQHLIPLHEIYNHLVRRFGRDAVEKYDTKKQYLGRLYGALRGQTGQARRQPGGAIAQDEDGGDNGSLDLLRLGHEGWPPGTLPHGGVGEAARSLLRAGR